MSSTGKQPRSAASLTPQEIRTPTSSRSAIWSRYSTLINLWLDVLLAILFVIQGWILAVLQMVFPRGAGPDWRVWGLSPLDWSEALFVVYWIFSIAVVLHVMLHWEWVCGVVTTRLLGRKAGRDDGSHTLIGVGTLLILIHLVMVGILVARMGLVAPG